MVTDRDVRLSGEVRNAFTRDLRKLAATGAEIPLYLYVEVRQPRVDKPLRTAVAGNSLTYDLIDKKYRVVGSAGSDTLWFGTLDSAVTRACAFGDIEVIPLTEVRADGQYYFSVYGVLGKARVEALQGNTIDLMQYWDYKRPGVRTEAYAGLVLLQAVTPKATP